MKTTAWVAVVLGLAGCVGSELDDLGQTEEAICGNCGDDWMGANGFDAKRIMTAHVFAIQESNDAFWSQSVLNALQDPRVYARIEEDPAASHEAVQAVIGCAAMRGQTFFGHDGFVYRGWNGVAFDGIVNPWTNPTAQAVGACVTLLTNPFHIHTPVYPRGPIPGGAWPTVGLVRSTLDIYTASTFASPTQNFGINQDSDYQPGHVYDFDTTNGLTFYAGTGPGCSVPTYGSSTGDTGIRACCGSSACNDANAIAWNDDSCGTLFPTLYVSPSQFASKCPAGTTRINVMTRAWNSNSGATADAATAPGTRQPLTADQLAPHREGTFVVDLRYRNAWLSTDGTGRLVFDLGTAPYVFKYAYSFGGPSTSGQQWFNGRLCATDTAGALNCMARYVGPETSYCSGPRDDHGWTTCHTFCKVLRGILYCDNYSYPVTSYLEDPCALRDASVPGLGCLP